MASSMTLDTDSEDDSIPAGWEQRLTEDGRVFYVCHRTKETQWEHPVSGYKKKLSAELPFGWTRQVGPAGQIYYVNDITQKTSITDPRLAFITDERKKGDPTVRQRFDASSTALQVLQGRDLTGQFVIVTGANCGIGYETARSLALHGASVTLACRNMPAANCAIQAIRKERPAAEVEAMFIDLTNLSTVRQFADNYLKRDIPLHILILNAGVFSLPHSLTDDGYETTFQTNHLAHFYLTQLLTDLLLKSKPSRVVVVSSESHRFTDVNDRTICEALLSPPTPAGFRPIFAYNASKACNVLFMFELHRRLSKCDVHVFAAHPGNMVSTGITRHWWLWRLLFGLVRPFAKSKQQGAATSVFCATAAELCDVSGNYFNNGFNCIPSDEVKNIETAARLWDISERMVARARTLIGGDKKENASWSCVYEV